MNLYQYLSPRSNHPPGMIKGIIYGLLKTYKNQNTHTEDYLYVVIKLFNCHAARGWNRTVLKRMILEINSKLERKLLLSHCSTLAVTRSPHTQNILSSPNRLFIHMENSKNDMPKKALRSIVEATLKDTIDELDVSQITVAYYRPENIKDHLSKAKLHQAKGNEVSTYYGMRNTTYIGSPQFFYEFLRSRLPGFSLRLLAPDFVKKIAFFEGVRENSEDFCFIFEN